MLIKRTAMAAALAFTVTLTGCGGSSSDGNADNGDSDLNIDIPNTYAFESAFIDGESSVSYSGQTARHVLIDGLNQKIASGLQVKIDDGTWNSGTTNATILAELEIFFDEGTDFLTLDSIDVPAFPENTEQTAYGDLSGNKNLVGKIAGNDAVTDHRNWTGGDFVGWDSDSPEALVRQWFVAIAENVKTALEGTNRQVDLSASGSGVHNLQVYHTNDGLDLKQLVQKFLLGAIAMSQGMDDYLDDDVAGKGLLSDNTQDGTNPYSSLEHQWDEGFGYFGAARNYGDYTDDELAGKGGRPEFANGYNDADGGGTIDLESEYNFGHSTNAAKRDRGSSTGTDFTKGAFEGFLTGRAIIRQAAGRDLTDEEMNALKEARNQAERNWEQAVAATVVHYINDTLGDMGRFGSESYSYADHTKHWAEMKGFALGLQFNPRSPLLADLDADGIEDFAHFHALVGERPVLPNASAQQISDYESALLEARNLLQTAYGFDAQDVENW